MTGARTATLADASGTFSFAIHSACSAGASCTETVTQGVKTLYGRSAALDGASPSVAAVTFSTGFTSTSSYTCSASPVGNTAAIAAGGVAVTYTSATVVTFTAANAATHTIGFVCVGN